MGGSEEVEIGRWIWGEEKGGRERGEREGERERGEGESRKKKDTDGAGLLNLKS